jgi:hypothetical protein
MIDFRLRSGGQEKRPAFDLQRRANFLYISLDYAYSLLIYPEASSHAYNQVTFARHREPQREQGATRINLLNGLSTALFPTQATSPIDDQGKHHGDQC